MKKQKSTSRLVSKHQLFGRYPLRLSLVILLVFIVGAQLVFDGLLYNRTIRNGGDQTTIISLISQAVEAANKPAVIDGPTGKVYLTDAHLVLPASKAPTDQLRYSYSGAFDTMPAEIQVTTKQAITRGVSRLWSAQATTSPWRASNSDHVFAQVPPLQACARGVLGVFDAVVDTKQYGTLQSTLKLADGRTLSWYTENPEKCPLDLTPLVSYLKQAASY